MEKTVDEILLDLPVPGEARYGVGCRICKFAVPACMRCAGFLRVQVQSVAVNSWGCQPWTCAASDSFPANRAGSLVVYLWFMFCSLDQ